MADINIHGRSGYSRLVSLKDNNIKLDLSNHTIWFEVSGTPIRKLLPVDSTDPQSKRLTLTVEDVEAIPANDTYFAFRDETSAPYVIGEGTISRTGFKGEPA